MTIAAIYFEKAPRDDWTYSFDVAAFGVMRAGDTLVSGTVTCSDSGISIGTATVSGSYIQARVYGGTAGTTYKLVVEATTAAGARLAGFANCAVSVPAGFS